MKVKIEISICTGLMLNDHSNPYIESTTVLSDIRLLCTISESYIIQVNEKFYKLERVYRDCIKMTRDKTCKDIQYTACAPGA